MSSSLIVDRIIIITIRYKCERKLYRRRSMRREDRYNVLDFRVSTPRRLIDSLLFNRRVGFYSNDFQISFHILDRVRLLCMIDFFRIVGVGIFFIKLTSQRANN